MRITIKKHPITPHARVTVAHEGSTIEFELWSMEDRRDMAQMLHNSAFDLYDLENDQPE